MNNTNDNITIKLDDENIKNTQEEKLNHKSLNKKIKFRHWIIAVTIVVSCILIVISLVILIPQKPYYETEAFASLSAKEKVITILSHEGENKLNDDINSYSIRKIIESGDIDLTFSINYYQPNDEISCSLISSSSKYEITTQVFFNMNNFRHDCYTTYYSGSNLVYIGSAKVYAPTYYSDVKISFNEYRGTLSQSSVENATSSNIFLLLNTINKMFNEYNFSLSEFSFYRFI